VSVGNLTVGGSGKTPLVIFLAERLRLHGWKPAILTRGYGRLNENDLVVLDPSQGNAHVARAGDEPAMMARSCPDVPIIVCKDRYRGGKLAEDRFGVDLHLLDDGFQHLALVRDVDVVALDVTQSVFEDRLLPLGRLREPIKALERADIVVLTRTELADSRQVEDRVRKIHRRAQIFHARTGLRAMTDRAGMSAISLERWKERPVAAFCGLGNPEAFFENLRRWGFRVCHTATFRDHHRYDARDLERLEERARRAGATAMVTTEKDSVNLPPAPRTGLPLLVCGVRLEILEGESFDQAVLSRLEAAKLGER
jgi:tetraacyldisaccharide 4'-kinase